MPAIVIFEPWALGDVFVALNLVPILRERGFRVVVICHVKWQRIVAELNVADAVYGIKTTWSVQTPEALNWRKYFLADTLGVITTMRRIIATEVVTGFYNVRGGHIEALWTKLACGGLCSSYSTPAALVDRPYQRISLALAQAIRDERVAQEQLEIRFKPSQSGGEKTGIFCFFGSAWKAKRLPSDQAMDLLTSLAARWPEINLIIPHEGIETEWQQRLRDVPIRHWKASIPALVKEMQARARLVISTDSVFLHVAAFLGIPRVGLFAFDNHDGWLPPRSQLVTPPRVLPCNLIYQRKKGPAEEPNPFASLEVAVVNDAVEASFQP